MRPFCCSALWQSCAARACLFALALSWGAVAGAQPPAADTAKVDTTRRPARPAPVDSAALRPAAPRYRIVRPYAPASASERQVAISHGRSRVNFGSRQGVQPGSIFEVFNGGLMIGLVQVDSVARDTSWVRLIKLENVLDPRQPYPLDRDCELKPKLVALETVYFDGETPALPPSLQERLRHVAGFILSFPDSPVLLEGHSDNKGKKTDLLKQSAWRAERLRTYLHEFHHIPLSRMRVRAYGDERPIAANATEEGRRQNRRVEITLVDKVPLGDKVEALQDTAAGKAGASGKNKK